MSDDLKGRLAALGFTDYDETYILDYLPSRRFVTLITDRIEALERELKAVLDREAATHARHDAKIEALEREREAHLATLEHMGDAVKRMQTAEARLAKAVEALRVLLATAHADDHAGWQDALKEATAVLAEIGG